MNSRATWTRSLLAPGDVEGASPAKLAQPETFDERLHALLSHDLGDPPKVPVQVEVVLHGGELERFALLYDTDPVSDLSSLAPRVTPEDAQLAGRGLDQRGHGLDERGFPSPVPPQQPEDLPSGDGETHIVERETTPVVGMSDLLGQDDRLPIRGSALAQHGPEFLRKRDERGRTEKGRPEDPGASLRMADIVASTRRVA